MLQKHDVFYSEYKSLLRDVAQRLTEAKGFSGWFLSSEHCADNDEIREEITRHFYLCAGAAMYFREIAPASLEHMPTMN